MNNIDKIKELLNGDSHPLAGELLEQIQAYEESNAPRRGHVYRDKRTGRLGVLADNAQSGRTLFTMEDGSEADGLGGEEFEYVGPLSDYGKPPVPGDVRFTPRGILITGPDGRTRNVSSEARDQKTRDPEKGDLYRHVEYGLGIVVCGAGGRLRVAFLDGFAMDWYPMFGADTQGYIYLGRADKLLHLTPDAVATDKD